MSCKWASQVTLAIKNLPANAGRCNRSEFAAPPPPPVKRGSTDLSLISGWEDPLEEGMATHSSILAWKTP